MTLNELITNLQELADSGYGDYGVLVVYQPRYPLRENVVGVWVDEEPRDNPGEDEFESAEEFVYVVADGHPHGASPYGPREAFCH